jgi:hypothetical protein
MELYPERRTIRDEGSISHDNIADSDRGLPKGVSNSAISDNSELVQLSSSHTWKKEK